MNIRTSVKTIVRDPEIDEELENPVIFEKKGQLIPIEMILGLKSVRQLKVIEVEYKILVYTPRPSSRDDLGNEVKNGIEVHVEQSVTSMIEVNGEEEKPNAFTNLIPMLSGIDLTNLDPDKIKEIVGNPASLKLIMETLGNNQTK